MTDTELMRIRERNTFRVFGKEKEQLEKAQDDVQKLCDAIEQDRVDLKLASKIIDAFCNCNFGTLDELLDEWRTRKGPGR